jgi:hypothetical protein
MFKGINHLIATLWASENWRFSELSLIGMAVCIEAWIM